MKYLLIIIFIFNAASWERYSPENSLLTESKISSMLVDSENRIWVSGGYRSLHCFDNGEWIDYTNKRPDYDQYKIRNIIEDENGNIIFHSYGSILLFNNLDWEATNQEFSPQLLFSVDIQYFKKKLYVNTAHEDIHYLDYNELNNSYNLTNLKSMNDFKTLKTPEELGIFLNFKLFNKYCYGYCFGKDLNGIVEFDMELNSWRYLDFDQTLPIEFGETDLIKIEIVDNVLYLLYQDQRYFVEYDLTTNTAEYHTYFIDSINKARFVDFHNNQDNSFLICYELELLFLDENRNFHLINKPEEFDFTEWIITEIEQDQNGDYWLGTFHSGVYKFNKEELFNMLSVENGVPQFQVHKIKPNPIQNKCRIEFHDVTKSIDYKFKLYNIKGSYINDLSSEQVIHNKTYYEYQLEFPSVNPGVYFIEISSENINQYKLVIIE